MVGYSPAFFTPRPVVALPWGSRSTRSVGRSASASPAARFIAVVVFPTPPFWLTIARVLANPTRRLYVVNVPRRTPYTRHMSPALHRVPRATLSTLGLLESIFP